MDMRKKIISFIILIFLGAILGNFYIISQLKRACSRQDQLSYQIKRQHKYMALEKRYKIESVNFTTKDNIQLVGILIKRPAARRVIICCHGYRQSKESLAELADLFNNDTLLFFDFRAHGASAGNQITYGDLESLDVKAAYNYIQDNLDIKHTPIYGLGISMGAVALLKASVEGVLFAGLVLDSGYAHLDRQAQRLFNKVTKLPQFVFGICSIVYRICSSHNLELSGCALINKITIPVFIIHSASDAITPLRDAYELYECAHQPKELWIAQDAKHGKIYALYPEQYKQKINAFFTLVERRTDRS
jgi:uncharacterized protein